MKRNGASLTEVLMSILVMGVGVLSVITLFPASFLRTMQATNITNATILRQNAEVMIDLDKTNRLHVFPYWQPNTVYAAGAVVLRNNPRDNRRYRLTSPAGPSGATEPGWDPTIGNSTADNGLTWECEDHSKYVIDPLGWHVVGPAFQDAYGNDGTGPFPAVPLERFNAATANAFTAAALVTNPDSWVNELQSVPTASTATTVDLAAGVDLAGIAAANTISRVTLLDKTGDGSLTRNITNIAGQQIQWDAAMPIPAGFAPAQVRVETQEQRYTWMLTVRRTLSGVASADIVTFFRRPLIPQDERVFAVSAIAQRDLTVDHIAGVKPVTKKGGFLLDIDNARWYRVADAVELPTNQTRVTIDRLPLGVIGQVICPRGVVDVFPVGSSWDSQ